MNIECKQATHEELVDQAISHYQEISSRAGHYNSVVDKALAFYREYGDYQTQKKIKYLLTQKEEK